MPGKSVNDVLLEAADLIERNWVQGRAAQTAEGKSCIPRNPSAVKWCASGALEKASDNSWDTYYEVIERFTNNYGSIVAYNDSPGRTSHQVASALRGLAHK